MAAVDPIHDLRKEAMKLTGRHPGGQEDATFAPKKIVNAMQELPLGFLFSGKLMKILTDQHVAVRMPTGEPVGLTRVERLAKFLCKSTGCRSGPIEWRTAPLPMSDDGPNQMRLAGARRAIKQY